MLLDARRIVMNAVQDPQVALELALSLPRSGPSSMR